MVCSLALKEAYRKSTLCVVQIFKRVHFNNGLNHLCTSATRPRSVHFLEDPQTRCVSVSNAPSVQTRCVSVNTAQCVQTRCVSVDARLRSRKSPTEWSRSPATGTGLSPAQKVKEAGKDFTYLIVVLFGIGVTGGLLYIVFKELFSSSSPSKIYGKALNKCRAHPEVIGAFGEPIKGYGEMSRRGRRQQVSHVEFLRDGVKHMRLKFYIEGSEPRLQGTVHTEMRENPTTGKYEFRYIFVELDSYPRRTIVVEDNRQG